MSVESLTDTFQRLDTDDVGELKQIIKELLVVNAELRRTNVELAADANARVTGVLWDKQYICTCECSETCPICIEENVNCKLAVCGHAFHDTCVGKLVLSTKRSVYCPSCRARIC